MTMMTQHIFDVVTSLKVNKGKQKHAKKGKKSNPEECSLVLERQHSSTLCLVLQNETLVQA
jgi:hypothetical protein